MRKITNLPQKSFLALCALVLFASCKKDEVMQTPSTPVSRLYVSNADVDAGTANLEVYDPADVSLASSTKIASGAKDGNGVYYDAGSNTLFQAGRMGKTIYYYNNASSVTSASTPSGSFTDASLSSARDIAYDKTNNTLFVANNTDSTLRIFTGANTAMGTPTGRVVKLSGQPWGIFFDAPNNRLLVLMDLAAMRIEVFNNPAMLTAGVATANSVLNISDRPNGTKSRIHGLTYSSKMDVLLVTEIGEAAAPAIVDPTKPAFNADGGIYIIEGAKAKLTAGGTVAATRFITGSNTGLGNPVDVAIDDRDNKGLIYVAEKANKKILVFKLTDNGNVAPTIQSPTLATSPEAIFLDAR